MNRIIRLLNIAADVATMGRDKRDFLVGCIAERKDGAIVAAHNGGAVGRTAAVHADFRVVRKSDVGSVFYVARVRRDNNNWTMAKPCRTCRMFMILSGAKRVYWTISPGAYGTEIF